MPAVVAVVGAAGLFLGWIWLGGGERAKPVEPVWSGMEVSAWIRRLYEGTPRQREEARKVLLSMEPSAAPFLARRLGHKEPVIQTWYQKLRRSHPQLVQNLPVVYDESWVRTMIGATLNRMTPEQLLPALPELEVLLKEADPITRARSAGLIARIGPRAAPAVDALTAALSDSEIFPQVAYALRRIGPAARRALPALADHLKNDSFASALAAGATICRLDPDYPGLPEGLVRILREGVPSASEAALRELLMLQWRAAGVLPELRELREGDAMEGSRYALNRTIEAIENSLTAKRRFEVRSGPVPDATATPVRTTR